MEPVTPTEIPNSVNSEVDGDELWTTIQKIEPAVADEKISNVIMACIAIALMLQNPFLTADELAAGIMSTSTHMVDFLNTTEAAAGIEVAKEALDVPLSTKN